MTSSQALNTSGSASAYHFFEIIDPVKDEHYEPLSFYKRSALLGLRTANMYLPGTCALEYSYKSQAASTLSSPARVVSATYSLSDASSSRVRAGTHSVMNMVPTTSALFSQTFGSYSEASPFWEERANTVSRTKNFDLSVRLADPPAGRYDGGNESSLYTEQIVINASRSQKIDDNQTLIPTQLRPLVGDVSREKLFSVDLSEAGLVTAMGETSDIFYPSTGDRYIPKIDYDFSVSLRNGDNTVATNFGNFAVHAVFTAWSPLNNSDAGFRAYASGVHYPTQAAMAADSARLISSAATVALPNTGNLVEALGVASFRGVIDLKDLATGDNDFPYISSVSFYITSSFDNTSGPGAAPGHFTAVQGLVHLHGSSRTNLDLAIIGQSYAPLPNVSNPFVSSKVYVNRAILPTLADSSTYITQSHDGYNVRVPFPSPHSAGVAVTAALAIL